jgi:hypothetical protein
MITGTAITVGRTYGFDNAVICACLLFVVDVWVRDIAASGVKS